MQRDSEFLATEKPSKLLLKLALPAVTAQLVNMLYNIVDRMYICLLYTSAIRSSP